MSKQHVAIERLDAQYKGLRLDVDLMFQDEKTLAEVQAMPPTSFATLAIALSLISSREELQAGSLFLTA